MRRHGPVLFLLASAVIASACGPSPATTAARLINAAMTKTTIAVTSGASSALTLNNQISCNGDVYTLTSSDVSATLTLANNTARGPVVAKLTGSGPGLVDPAESGSEASASLYCSITARWSYEDVSSGNNTSTIRLKGAGVMTASNGFECIMDGSKIEYEDLAAALESETCL